MYPERHITKPVARTLSSQFLFTTLLFVVLHHTRGMVASEQSRVATNRILEQSFHELLSPVLFDFGMLGAGFVLALLVIRFVGHPLAVQRGVAVVLFALTVLGALSVVYEAKTGDWLSLQVLTFGFANSHDVAGIVANEISLWQWGAALLAVLTLAISLFHAARIGRRFIVGLCGFGLMAIALNGVGQEDGQDRTYFSRTEQMGWLNEQSPIWHGSIILSALGYGHGESSRLKGLPPLREYLNPEFVSQTGSRPNIVVLVLESVRFSVTSPYALDDRFDAITPNLGKLASEGVVVDRAYTTVPHTSKALVGIFCGQFPRKEIAIREAEPDGMPFNCLPRILAQAGYETAYFQSAVGIYENRHGLVANMGFDYARTREQFPPGNFASVGYFGADDRIMLKPAIDWMKSRQSTGQPFMVGMLTVVSHHPYARPHEEPDISTPDKAYRAYEMSVHETDRFLGELVAEMREEGLMDNTLLVITGDHGEGFGEHGPRMHNGTAYEEGVRVPLILYGPDVITEPRKMGGLRQHLDLMPTILDLSGIQVSQALPGRSLFESEGHQQIAMQCWYENYCAVGIGEAGNKLIYWYGKRPLESFDLNLDPDERTNLAVQWDKEMRNAQMHDAFQHLIDLRTIYN